MIKLIIVLSLLGLLSACAEKVEEKKPYWTIETTIWAGEPEDRPEDLSKGIFNITESIEIVKINESNSVKWELVNSSGYWYSDLIDGIYIWKGQWDRPEPWNDSND